MKQHGMRVDERGRVVDAEGTVLLRRFDLAELVWYFGLDEA
jgi:hypothetical protein